MDSGQRWIVADLKAVERRTLLATDALERELRNQREERRAETRALLAEIRALRGDLLELRSG